MDGNAGMRLLDTEEEADTGLAQTAITVEKHHGNVGFHLDRIRGNLRHHLEWSRSKIDN